MFGSHVTSEGVDSTVGGRTIRTERSLWGVRVKVMPPANSANQNFRKQFFFFSFSFTCWKLLCCKPYISKAKHSNGTLRTFPRKKGGRYWIRLKCSCRVVLLKQQKKWQKNYTKLWSPSVGARTIDPWNTQPTIQRNIYMVAYTTTPRGQS